MKTLSIFAIAITSLVSRCNVPTPQSAPAPFGYPVPAVERWHSTAMRAGWPEKDWPHLACIIHRESNGLPFALNPNDPGLGSYGLLQINMSTGKWGTFPHYEPVLHGNVRNLYVPIVNLRIGRDLFNRSNGWSPWGKKPCP